MEPVVSLLEGLATTRAIRRFRPDPVPEVDLAAMLFAATRAPSGSNRQPWRFVVLRDGPVATEAKALLVASFRQGWADKRARDGWERHDGDAPDTPAMRTARAMQHFVDHFEEVPVVVLACLVRYREAVPFEGGSIYPACQNLLLAARALGYGGVMTGWHVPVEAELRALVGIPENVFLGATMALGRPLGGHGPVRRKPLGDVVYDDAWDQPAPWAVDPPGARFGRGGPPNARP